MKKRILFLALALTATTGLFAQKQTGGEKNIEVQFSPLGGSPISTNGIRFRMFNSESSAIRVGFGLGGSTVTTVNSQPNEFTGATTVALDALYDYERSFNFNIRPGYEIHFDGTDRLSPYVGVELMFGIGRNSIEREFFGGNTQGQVDNAEVQNFAVYTLTRTEGSTMLGLGALAGVDYYIADNLYLGAEIGFGFQRTTLRDVEVEVSDDNAFIFSSSSAAILSPLGYSGNAQADADFSDVVFVETSSTGVNSVAKNELVGDGSGDWKTFNWGTTFQPTIRLGWLFN